MRILGSLVLSALLIFVVGAGTVHAQSLGVSFRVGTGGVGAGLTKQLTRTLNGRIDASYFTYSFNGEEDLDETLVEYRGDGTLFFASALADWHPFNGTFRISGGGMYNGIEGRGTAVPIESAQIGRNSYSPDDMGVINVDVSFGSKVAPYVGIGAGNAATRRFGFLIDVGVIYAGTPQVNVEATRMLTPTESEAAQIEQNLDWVQWYPVVSIGFNIGL